MEFSVLHDLQNNSKFTIKDCFVTNVFMYDFTYDRYIMNLRHVLRIHPEMMFLEYINYILTLTNNSTHSVFPLQQIMKYEKPYNAVVVFKALIPQRTLTEYEKSPQSLLPRHVEIIPFHSSEHDYFFMDLSENDSLFSIKFPTDEIEITLL